MSPQARPHGWTRLGGKEKSILLLMLELDKPPGKNILLLPAIYSAFQIVYSSLPKNQQVEYREENKVKCVLYRLLRKGFILQVGVMDKDLNTPRGRGYAYYRLTKAGRLVALKLLQRKDREVRVVRDREVFLCALGQLRLLGQVMVSIGEVREVLWGLLRQEFVGRVEFERYWNSTKLGLLLKECAGRQVRAGVRDRRRKYGLANPEFFQNDQS